MNKDLLCVFYYKSKIILCNLTLRHEIIRKRNSQTVQQIHKNT